MKEISFLRDTKRIGDASEIAVIYALHRAGYRVAIPFGENNRYDLIIEKEGTLSRVQVKTGRLRRGVILFHPYSSHIHRNGVSCRVYAGEIEYFAVYCEQMGSTYLIPISDVATSGSLRVSRAMNGQAKRIRRAASYLVRENLPIPVGTTRARGVALEDTALPL